MKYSYRAEVIVAFYEKMSLAITFLKEMLLLDRKCIAVWTFLKPSGGSSTTTEVSLGVVEDPASR
ncbi:MAG: hypothetical protein JJT94_12610 [Bernardetiaceae bacterium]|nr:hypothetical protein [Bernardetiaceae bacterium]